MNLATDLPVTTVTTLVLAAWMIVLGYRVVLRRRSARVPYGDGEDRKLTKRIRAHANAAEQVPIALIMLGLAELGNTPSSWLWTMAGILIVGRFIHGVFFTFHGFPWQMRFIGMGLTFGAQILLIGTLVGTLISV